jgi:hypothetical protein
VTLRILHNLQLASSHKRDAASVIHCPSRVTQRLSSACTGFFVTQLSIFNPFSDLKTPLILCKFAEYLYVKIAGTYQKAAILMWYLLLP